MSKARTVVWGSTGLRKPSTVRQKCFVGGGDGGGSGDGSGDFDTHLSCFCLLWLRLKSAWISSNVKWMETAL